MVKIYMPPTLQLNMVGHKIFMGGTIDNGNSVDWQNDGIEWLKKHKISCSVFNPRRLNWDPNLKQDFETPGFFQQVSWEEKGLKISDTIILNFLPKSLSPITLLELGLHAASGKVVVCCPKEFWRSGNVEATCVSYNIPLYRNMESLLIGTFIDA